MNGISTVVQHRQTFIVQLHPLPWQVSLGQDAGHAGDVGRASAAGALFLSDQYRPFPIQCGNTEMSKIPPYNSFNLNLF